MALLPRASLEHNNLISQAPGVWKIWSSKYPWATINGGTAPRVLVGVGIFQHADPAAARYSAGRQPALLEFTKTDVIPTAFFPVLHADYSRQTQ